VYFEGETSLIFNFMVVLDLLGSQFMSD